MRNRNRFKHALVAWVAGIVLSLPAHGAKWPTTQFVFENSNPLSTIPLALQPSTGFTSKQQPVVAEYEKYLGEVAIKYQAMGFKAPPLPLVAGRKGGKAFRVHLYNYDNRNALARARPLPDGSSELHVDLSRAIVNGKPVDRLFEDLAHELFHNVQYAYISLEQNQEARRWIMEGQAQALGMDTARDLRGTDVNKGVNDGYRLGGRPYYQSLGVTDNHKDRAEDYRTSSFWRYVGEHSAAAAKNGRAGVQPVDPDYSYLAKVLARSLGNKPPGAADLQWLDAGLKQVSGLGLQRLYAGFVTTFAAYVPDRLTKPPSGTAQEAQDNWLHYLFGSCPEMTLSSRAPSNSVLAPLRKNAARCFKVNIAGSGRADVSLQTRAETVPALEALQIGTAGGERIGGAQIVPSPSGGGYIGHWRFRINAGTPYVFIISNVAANPATSLHQDLTINATFSQWISDLSQPRAKQGSKESSKKSSTAKPAAPASKREAVPADATRTAAREELATGLEALSNQTALGASASFERARPRCREPFGVTTCGPLTSIQLQLTPGALGDMTQTTGVGGGLAQFMAQMTAIADNGVAQTDAQWRRALEEVRDTEGSTVTITIPLIEYGFTGAFDNAAIVVNGGAGHGNFQALGPQDSIAGRGREYRQSGRVTILEFTPYMLRGTFHAGLTDMSALTFTEEDADMSLPVDREISGEFVIAAPWEGDREVTEYQVQSTEAALQDVSQAFPVVGNRDVEEILAAQASAAQSGVAQSGGGVVGELPPSPVGDFPRCACDCQPIASLAPECKPICKVKLRACWAEDSRERAREQKAEAPATEAPARQTRAEYIEGLRREGMDEAQIDRIMPGIDAFWSENGGWGD